jgi:hypothetical protein
MKVKNSYVIEYQGRAVPVFECENGKWWIGIYNFAGQLHLTSMHPVAAKKLVGIDDDDIF